MTALVTIETLLLVLLAFLVAGLLRSHAEILRSLNAPAIGEGASEIPPEEKVGGVSKAVEFTGTTMRGDAVHVPVPHPSSRLVLAFLTSGCTSCRSMWRVFQNEHLQLPGNAELMVVTRDRTSESTSRLRKLGASAVPLVMSSSAWEAYRVPGSPYFVCLDGKNVRGEGSADSWQGVLSFLEDALDDAEFEEHAMPSGGGNGSRDRDSASDRARPAEDVKVAQSR